MSLRIAHNRFFLDTYRTRQSDTTTNREQAECEQRIEKIFRTFLNEKASFGSK